jgi:hypothetical protein
MTRTCTDCETAKPLDAFPRKGRGYGKVCRDCLTPHAVAPAAEPPDVKLAIAVEPGFGFQAHLQGEALHIAQHDAEGKQDLVILSRTEAKVLFAQFAAWVD